MRRLCSPAFLSFVSFRFFCFGMTGAHSAPLLSSENLFPTIDKNLPTNIGEFVPKGDKLSVQAHGSERSSDKYKLKQNFMPARLTNAVLLVYNVKYKTITRKLFIYYA